MRGISGHKHLSNVAKPSVSVIAVLTMMLSTLSGVNAYAGDEKGLIPLRTAPISTTPGLNFNLSIPNSGLAPIQSPVNMPSLSLDGVSTGTMGSSLFDVPTAAVGCLAGEQACLTQPIKPLDLGFSKSMKKTKAGGLDVELVPSASVRFDEGEQSALVGAVVRIGDDLRSKDVASNTWYVFAGADAEALSYSPDRSTRGITSDFQLQDRIIIGDAQAGIGYRIGDADLSLGYFRREVNSFNDTPGSAGFSSTEDAAALSFTWKR